MKKAVQEFHNKRNNNKNQYTNKHGGGCQSDEQRVCFAFLFARSEGVISQLCILTARHAIFVSGLAIKEQIGLRRNCKEKKNVNTFDGICFF